MTMRVGIAGTGTMGEVHAKAWRTVGAELAGFASLRHAQARDLSLRFGVRAYAEYTELVEDVDIVDICTPTSRTSLWRSRRRPPENMWSAKSRLL
jgi:predicted dehydrogenase